MDFRDCIRAHPPATEAYELLTRTLAPKYAGQINNYTDGKTDFIRDVEKRARTWRAEGNLPGPAA